MFGGENDYWDEPDFILTYIVTALVNGMGMEIGVTVTLRGLVISGTLISEAAYLDIVSKTLQDQVSFAGDTPEDAKEALHNILDLRMMREFEIDDLLRMGADDEDEDEGSDTDKVGAEAFEEFEVDMEEMPPPVQHLHMKDPLLVAGDPPISFSEGSDVVLRLRLASVDSWMIGRLLPDLPDFPDFGSNGMTH